MKILFVCLGNICRSPIAEGVLAKMDREKSLGFTVHSAGTNRHHKGGPADERSVRICKKRGVDISKHIARRFRVEDFTEYDLIYTMAADVVEEMQEFVSKPAHMEKVRNFLDELSPRSKMHGKDVPDPWYGGEEGFSECFDLIEACCAEIAEKYRAK